MRHPTYLDDFIIPCSPILSRAQTYIEILNQACRALGVPLAEHKRDGPTTCLTFLGIEVDTVAGQLRLPQDKLQRLIALLSARGVAVSCVLTRTWSPSSASLTTHAKRSELAAPSSGG